MKSIVEQYRDGMLMTEIAEERGLHPTTVSRRLKAAGITCDGRSSRKRSLVGPELDDVLSCYVDDGLTFLDIAQIYGVSNKTVRARVLAAGYTKADRGTGRHRGRNAEVS